MEANGRKVIARWQTRGKDYLELFQFAAGDYGYTGNGCGGVLGNLAATDQEAIAHMEKNAVRVLKSDRPSLRRII